MKQSDGKWVQLRNLHLGSTFNVVGVVVSSRPPKLSGGTDSVVHIGITDDTLDIDELIPVNIFRKNFSEFPEVVEGCICVLTYMKTKQFDGKIQGCGYKETGFALYKPVTEIKGLPEPFYVSAAVKVNASKGSLQPPCDLYSKANELALKLFPDASYANDLNRPMKRKLSADEPHIGKKQLSRQNSDNNRSGGSRPLLAISSVKETTIYFDLVCEVISVSAGTCPSNLRVEVTDYSKNDLILPTISPLSQMIAHCYLWDNFKDQIANVEPEAYVLIQNLKAKIFGNVFELHLRGDKTGLQKVFVLKDDDDRLKDLLKRKRAIEGVPEEEKPERIEIPDEAVERKLINVSRAKAFETVPSKFCSEVKLVDYLPKDLKQFPPGEISPNETVHAVYIVVKDQTGHIPILLVGDELRRFFGIELKNFQKYEERINFIRQAETLKEQSKLITYCSFQDNGKIKYRFLDVVN